MNLLVGQLHSPSLPSPFSRAGWICETALEGQLHKARLALQKKKKDTEPEKRQTKKTDRSQDTERQKKDSTRTPANTIRSSLDDARALRSLRSVTPAFFSAHTQIGGKVCLLFPRPLQKLEMGTKVFHP
jgi:hypothetical protein